MELVGFLDKSACAPASCLAHSFSSRLSLLPPLLLTMTRDLNAVCFCLSIFKHIFSEDLHCQILGELLDRCAWTWTPKDTKVPCRVLGGAMSCDRLLRLSLQSVLQLGGDGGLPQTCGHPERGWEVPGGADRARYSRNGVKRPPLSPIRLSVF